MIKRIKKKHRGSGVRGCFEGGEKKGNRGQTLVLDPAILRSQVQGRGNRGLITGCKGKGKKKKAPSE